ncbi:hypothetical protein RhiJN_13942 [Ceratobasidium sp. AG-Ba]|nr:hypothetical protein RhiJN_13942 [Ceratobasidium sp. AG-Ba]QRW14500.1 hypothetical protein RhiLY_13499 [Ceratobasidium sp. AG-Ba]
MASSPKLYVGLDYDGDEESGAVLDLLDQGNKFGGVGGMGELSDVNPEESTWASDKDIAIDPALLALGAHVLDNLPGSSDPPLQSGELHPAHSSVPGQDAVPPCFGSEMPPPPILQPHLGAPAKNIKPAQDKSAKGKKQVSTTVAVSNGAQAPKRRGRPPGSKNKKKAAKVDTVNTGDDEGDE